MSIEDLIAAKLREASSKPRQPFDSDQDASFVPQDSSNSAPYDNGRDDGYDYIANQGAHLNQGNLVGAGCACLFIVILAVILIAATLGMLITLAGPSR